MHSVCVAVTDEHWVSKEEIDNMLDNRNDKPNVKVEKTRGMVATYILAIIFRLS